MMGAVVFVAAIAIVGAAFGGGWGTSGYAEGCTVWFFAAQVDVSSDDESPDAESVPTARAGLWNHTRQGAARAQSNYHEPTLHSPEIMESLRRNHRPWYQELGRAFSRDDERLSGILLRDPYGPLPPPLRLILSLYRPYARCIEWMLVERFPLFGVVCRPIMPITQGGTDSGALC